MLTTEGEARKCVPDASFPVLLLSSGPVTALVDDISSYVAVGCSSYSRNKKPMGDAPRAGVSRIMYPRRCWQSGPVVGLLLASSFLLRTNVVLIYGPWSGEPCSSDCRTGNRRRETCGSHSTRDPVPPLPDSFRLLLLIPSSKGCISMYYTPAVRFS